MSRFPSLAVRNVARNRRRSAITLAAIIFGVTAVVVLKGFLGAFSGLMLESVIRGNTGALQVHRQGYLASLTSLPLDLDMPYDDAFIRRIEAVRGVTGVTGRILFSGLVSNGRSQTMFVGRAIDPEKEHRACPNADVELTAGKMLEPSDYSAGLVGDELAKSFDAVVPSGSAPLPADAVTSLTLSSSSPGGRANSLDIRLKGTTSSPFPFENKRSITVPLKLAQDLLGMQGRVTEYAVAIDDLSQLDRVVADLRHALGPEYEVSTWQEVKPFFKDVITRQNFVLGLISLILFVIVLTGIANTMLMSVFERVREIGTMLAVGVRRAQVLGLFLLEAAVLGVAGGILGALVGNAVVAAISVRGIPMHLVGPQLVRLRPSVELTYVLAVVAVAVFGSVLSAAYPAWKASRLNPVDALRSV